MAKIALLIGVSEYQAGFEPLPAVKQDLEEMRRVLENPEIGDFEVKDLLNKPASDIHREMGNLFNKCQQGDTVLLYFSGHGVLDGDYRFHLIASDTHYDGDGTLFPPSVIAASDVHRYMERSPSNHKVVILDCCHGGAFIRGLKAKRTVNVVATIKEVLDGKGRAVLVASSASQLAFQQEDSGLSIYTRCLVEGLETGEADYDDDGFILAHELHEYAQKRVKEITPKMEPEISTSQEGYRIIIAKTPRKDPSAMYKHKLEGLEREAGITNSSGDDIDDIFRPILDSYSQEIGLPAEEADHIESDFLVSWRSRKRRFRQYEQAVYVAATGQGIEAERKRLEISRKEFKISVDCANRIEQAISQKLRLDSEADENSITNIDFRYPETLTSQIHELEHSQDSSNLQSLHVHRRGQLLGKILTQISQRYLEWYVLPVLAFILILSILTIRSIKLTMLDHNLAESSPSNNSGEQATLLSPELEHSTRGNDEISNLEEGCLIEEQQLHKDAHFNGTYDRNKDGINDVIREGMRVAIEEREKVTIYGIPVSRIRVVDLQDKNNSGWINDRVKICTDS